MDKQKLHELVLKLFPQASIGDGKQFVTITVEKDQLLTTADKLKKSPELQFDYLFCESAVDFNDHFIITYHLDSTVHHHQVVLKTKISDRMKPSVDSVCKVWTGAEYHEREIFDLFGIHFNGHPDLRKIFLDNDWVGFPLRKDYVDDVNIVER
jgi:NADH/F420H2 dehydrogenase subunit C